MLLRRDGFMSWRARMKTESASGGMGLGKVSLNMAVLGGYRGLGGKIGVHLTRRFRWPGARPLLALKVLADLLEAVVERLAVMAAEPREVACQMQALAG